MSTLDDQAIKAALAGRWQEAVALNQQIVSHEKKNIDALNRLAYAFAQTGNYKEACGLYEKVLKLDLYNPLATKNLAKFKKYHQNSSNHTSNPHEIGTISPSLFLSDAEKTKTINLINIASSDVLGELAVGEEVFPVAKRFELHLKNMNNKYIGTLPDDIGHPLLKLFRETTSNARFFVKDVQSNHVMIFIKY